MARDYRESVIQMDHGAGIASIWTMERGLAARLLRLGWSMANRQGSGFWYTAPIKAITFRKVSSIGARRGNPAWTKGMEAVNGTR